MLCYFVINRIKLYYSIDLQFFILFGGLKKSSIFAIISSLVRTIYLY
ncbi:hypothetical protein E27107_620007 [Elizabethkingia anophelis]|nr:hypothetical protein E18064_480003 [Elizabethkingia anophelis]CDN79641.1 hypothetical protein E27107_620007 [Elizabethkingia anophelis]